ncbi:MAG: hypothetical protein BWY57_02373 [Betaproteobacteria bacterium ADurb.Bin341]|nr:MAG: hypothetical protein BWY57_02373 [Betaproteobacteria bacterium ADurb.Bin341]
MNYKKSIFAPIFATILLLVGCVQKEAKEIDFGTIKDSIYQNDYFGMSVKLPPEWSVQDRASLQRISESGGKMIAGDDKNLKLALKASEMRSVNLFGVFRHPLGKPVQFNPNIGCVAEKVSHLPGITKGADYLYHSRKMLEASQIKFTFPNEMSSEKIGGESFDVMHTEILLAGQKIHQKYYASVMKGYAVAFVLSYLTSDDEAALQSILNTTTFNN